MFATIPFSDWFPKEINELIIDYLPSAQKNDLENSHGINHIKYYAKKSLQKSKNKYNSEIVNIIEAMSPDNRQYFSGLNRGASSPFTLIELIKSGFKITTEEDAYAFIVLIVGMTERDKGFQYSASVCNEWHGDATEYPLLANDKAPCCCCGVYSCCGACYRLGKNLPAPPLVIAAMFNSDESEGLIKFAAARKGDFKESLATLNQLIKEVYEVIFRGPQSQVINKIPLERIIEAQQTLLFLQIKFKEHYSRSDIKFLKNFMANKINKIDFHTEVLTYYDSFIRKNYIDLEKPIEPSGTCFGFFKVKEKYPLKKYFIETLQKRFIDTIEESTQTPNALNESIENALNHDLFSNLHENYGVSEESTIALGSKLRVLRNFINTPQ